MGSSLQGTMYNEDELLVYTPMQWYVLMMYQTYLFALDTHAG